MVSLGRWPCLQCSLPLFDGCLSDCRWQHWQPGSSAVGRRWTALGDSSRDATAAGSGDHPLFFFFLFSLGTPGWQHRSGARGGNFISCCHSSFLFIFFNLFCISFFFLFLFSYFYIFLNNFFFKLFLFKIFILFLQFLHITKYNFSNLRWRC